MAGVEYSFSGIGFGWDSHAAWVGSAFGSPPFNFILHFNEDGAMLLMRRTGWARTNISHENGWNDIAWLYDWLVRYTYITFTRKVLCIPIFSNFKGGANVCTVLLQQLAKRPKYFERLVLGRSFRDLRKKPGPFSISILGQADQLRAGLIPTCSPHMQASKRLPCSGVTKPGEVGEWRRRMATCFRPTRLRGSSPFS
jgi:hypothetical protein